MRPWVGAPARDRAWRGPALLAGRGDSYASQGHKGSNEDAFHDRMDFSMLTGLSHRDDNSVIDRHRLRTAGLDKIECGFRVGDQFSAENLTIVHLDLNPSSWWKLIQLIRNGRCRDGRRIEKQKSEQAGECAAQQVSPSRRYRCICLKHVQLLRTKRAEKRLLARFTAMIETADKLLPEQCSVFMYSRATKQQEALYSRYRMIPRMLGSYWSQRTSVAVRTAGDTTPAGDDALDPTICVARKPGAFPIEGGWFSAVRRQAEGRQKRLHETSVTEVRACGFQ